MDRRFLPWKRDGSHGGGRQSACISSKLRHLGGGGVIRGSHEGGLDDGTYFLATTRWGKKLKEFTAITEYFCDYLFRATYGSFTITNINELNMDLMEEISPILMTAEPTPTDLRSEEGALQRMLSTRSAIGETQSSWPKERQTPIGCSIM